MYSAGPLQTSWDSSRPASDWPFIVGGMPTFHVPPVARPTHRQHLTWCLLLEPCFLRTAYCKEDLNTPFLTLCHPFGSCYQWSLWLLNCHPWMCSACTKNYNMAVTASQASLSSSLTGLLILPRLQWKWWQIWCSERHLTTVVTCRLNLLSSVYLWSMPSIGRRMHRSSTVASGLPCRFFCIFAERYAPQFKYRHSHSESFSGCLVQQCLSTSHHTPSFSYVELIMLSLGFHPVITGICTLNFLFTSILWKLCGRWYERNEYRGRICLQPKRVDHPIL